MVLAPLLPASVIELVNRPNTPMPAPELELGISPGASPTALRRCSSFCLYSSASWRAMASAVLACTSSSTNESGSGVVGITGSVCVRASEEVRLPAKAACPMGVDLLRPSLNSRRPALLGALGLLVEAPKFEDENQLLPSDTGPVVSEEARTRIVWTFFSRRCFSV